ncbi:hypothetical protein L1987_02043 [Smallanthus sonchifolius]|uniref:Uncharacterized protein n=1 Tax=Smallanthus sonchifolius TaxID=185202 RepID=A0ACB9K6Q4_9ASTR|nr:hypothetical protein L1987_02043 [Smallanthus sonchifolius]
MQKKQIQREFVQPEGTTWIQRESMKCQSELEGDCLENYYKFVDESSTLKHGGLNKQELEKIRHESEMLWLNLKKSIKNNKSKVAGDSSPYGIPNHLDINLRITYMRYLDLIEYYHQNVKDRRDLKENGNSGKDEVVNETDGLDTANGSQKFKWMRFQAIWDFPPMCGPYFWFTNFTILGTKTRVVTPESEPKEDEVNYEDQAILDVRMDGS